MLKNFKIGPKIASLSVLALLGLALLAFLQLMTIDNILMEDRRDKLRTATETLITLSTSYQDRVTTGELDQQAAIDAYFKELSKVRYDKGTGYFFVISSDYTIKMHPIATDLVGKNHADMQDANGTYFNRKQVEEGMKPDGGFTSYLWPKPGSDEPVEKLAFSYKLPWGDVLSTGIYVDDVRAIFWDQATQAIIICIAIIAALVIVGLWIGRDITGSLGKLAHRMSTIAGGDLKGEIEGQDRKRRSRRHGHDRGCFPRSGA